MFSEEFALPLPAIVNFVGGGGKTGLILRLLEEYSTSVPSVYTTTTRIHPPEPSGGLVLVSSDNPGCLKKAAERLGREAWTEGRRFVLTGLEMSPGLLRGVAPDFAGGLDRQLFPVVLNEADGAKSMSIKVPREGEPVLMEGADALVPVIGLDCLNRPLGPEVLFRWQLAVSRFHLKAGRILTPELAASILLHPEGVCKDWKPGTVLIPFINKSDSEADDPLAKQLAFELLNNPNFPVERVVWGSLMHSRAASITARRQ